MGILKFKKKILECYSKEMCYPLIADKWNEENRSLGMCAITAILVNDYFGGDICKIKVDGVSHYFNLIKGEIIDLTSDQFNIDVNYSEFIIVNKESLLEENTKDRYMLLKDKFILSNGDLYE